MSIQPGATIQSPILPLVKQDSGKESLKWKRALEEGMHSFSGALDNYSQESQQVSSGIGNKTALAGLERAGVLPSQITETSSGNVTPLNTESEIELAMVVKGFSGQQLPQQTLFSTLNNLHEVQPLKQAQNPALTDIINGLHYRMKMYPKTNMTLTGDEQGAVIWLRDFDGNCGQDHQEVIQWITQFFSEQQIPLKAIMLNGQLYQAFKE